jgi:hypothetical protein
MKPERVQFPVHLHGAEVTCGIWGSPGTKVFVYADVDGKKYGTTMGKEAAACFIRSLQEAYDHVWPEN